MGPVKTAIWQMLFLTTLWKNLCAKIVARKFLQNVGILTLANVAGAALNFAQGILVARSLGPELYGVGALVMSYPTLVHGFFDARSLTASVKYLGEYHARGEHDRALAMCKLGYAVDLAVACLTFLVLVLTAGWAADSIAHNPAVAGLMILYGAALIPRALVGTSNAVMATLGRFPFIASIETVITLVRVLLVTGLVLAGWQVAGVVWANAVASIVAGLLYGSVALTLSRRAWGGSVIQASLKPLKGRRQEIFSFLAYNDMGALVGMIPKQLDVVLLGYLRNPTEVGYYRISKSISSTVGYLTQPLRSVTYPELARLWGVGDVRAVSQNVQQLVTWIGLPLGLLGLAASGLMPLVLPLLVGEIYLPAVAATQLLFIASTTALVFFWLRPVYLVRGHIREWFILGSSVTVVFGLFYPFVIREWGYIGASGWMLALTVVEYGVLGYWLWKQAKQNEQYRYTVERIKKKRTIDMTDESLAESAVQEKT